MRRDGAANRERILVAAEQVFGAGGPTASTEEVARRAEVGIATVFRHFPTKQELVEATAVRYLEGLQVRSRELVGQAEPGSALASLFRVLVATGPTKVTLLNLLLGEGQELPGPITATVRAIREDVRRVLDRAQAVGAARPDATVEDVLTLGRALAHAAAPDQDHAVDIVLDGLGIHRRAPTPQPHELGRQR